MFAYLQGHAVLLYLAVAVMQHPDDTLCRLRQRGVESAQVNTAVKSGIYLYLGDDNRFLSRNRVRSLGSLGSLGALRILGFLRYLRYFGCLGCLRCLCLGARHLGKGRPAQLVSAPCHTPRKHHTQRSQTDHYGDDKQQNLIRSHFFHSARLKSNSTVNISRRPMSMTNVAAHLATAGSAA